jgi:hypothetical protein
MISDWEEQEVFYSLQFSLLTVVISSYNLEPVPNFNSDSIWPNPASFSIPGVGLYFSKYVMSYFQRSWQAKGQRGHSQFCRN